MKVEAKFCEATEFEVTVMNYTKAELLGIFGEFKGRITKGEDGEKYFISAYAEYGDYDNSGEVERSNARVLKALHYPAGSIGWGAYGYVYYAVEIDPDLMSREQWDELIEIFRGLEDYPCIDEQAMGEVMTEAVDEAWSNWLCGDFCKAIASSACEDNGWYGVEIEHAIDLGGAMRSLFNDLCAGSGEYPIMEAGGNIWIDLERLVRHGVEVGEVTILGLAARGFIIDGE